VIEIFNFGINVEATAKRKHNNNKKKQLRLSAALITAVAARFSLSKNILLCSIAGYFYSLVVFKQAQLVCQNRTEE